MPCYSDPDESGPIHLRLDRVTRAACNLAKVLRRGGTEADLDADTREWMAAHDAWDARREAAEAAAGAAVQKPKLYTGTQQPEGRVVAAADSIYAQTVGDQRVRFFKKLTASGNTGWQLSEPGTTVGT